MAAYELNKRRCNDSSKSINLFMKCNISLRVRSMKSNDGNKIIGERKLNVKHMHVSVSMYVSISVSWIKALQKSLLIRIRRYHYH